jgi:hypothetical protein
MANSVAPHLREETVPPRIDPRTSARDAMPNPLQPLPREVPLQLDVLLADLPRGSLH